MAEFTEDESPHAASRSSGGGGGARNLPIESESMTVGSLITKPDKGGDAEEEIVDVGRVVGGRALSANAKRMLENLDKHGSVADAPAPPAGEAAPAAAATPAPAAPASTPAAPAPTTAPTDKPTEPPASAPAAPDPVAEVNERLLARNRELLSQLETARKAPPAAAAPSPRLKTLEEAERMYWEDPAGAIRRFLSVVIGAEDHASKDVDAELTGLYQDLTARELGTPIDQAAAASRESARTRALLARDKREAAAERERAAKQAAPDPEAAETEQMATAIGVQLKAVGADSKPLAEAYPLTMRLAERFDGMKPETLLWHVIKSGVASGEFRDDMPNDKLVAAAAAKIEAHYSGLVDEIGKARPQPSTPATQQQNSTAPPNATETDKQAGAPGQGPRTITNASASVAPATPPAAKTEPDQQTKPKFKNEQERRRYYANLRFGS